MKNSGIKISFIVPVYNSELYISRCAESLFAQTMEDLEFIFVDDCSPDRSVEILESVVALHSGRQDQVRIIRLEKNGGPGIARYEGFLQSRGEFVWFVDSDDCIDREAASTMYKLAAEARADMACCRRTGITPDGRSEVMDYKNDVGDKDKYLGYVITILADKASHYITDKLIRRTVLEKLKYVPEGKIAEDWALCVMAVHKAEKIVATDEALYTYYLRPGSLSRPMSAEDVIKMAAEDKENIDRIISYLEEEGLARKYRWEIQARKYVAKGSFAARLDDDEMYRRWKDTYREVNKVMLFNPYMNFHSRKLFILKWLRIETQYRRVMDAVWRFLKLK